MKWRARVYPERENQVVLLLQPFVRSKIICLATCSLQFAKVGSAATLPQQEKNSTAVVQRGRINFTGFM